MARLSALFDRIERAFEGARTRRLLAAAVVALFLGALCVIELGRRRLLPASLAGHVPRNPFRSVELAFWFLLAFEVVGLVLGLARSVANAAGKQFEIFSLILLRHAFEELGHVPEPIVWDTTRGAALHMVANGVGALAIFVLLGFYYAAQRHRPLSEDAKDTTSFIAAKKVVSLVLIAIFGFEAARGLWHGHGDFFEAFYTVIVFADVLIVLLSLRYSSSYHVVFRNSGLAVATVLLRVALAAPPYFNAALGVVATGFALGLTVACNRFAPVLRQVAQREEERRAAG